MKHLSSLDASFLHFESVETPMHVGSVLTLDLPPGYRGDFYEDVRTHLAGRLHLAPVFERQLAMMPLDLADPVWIDGDPDLDFHIRRHDLPKPGTRAQLESAVGRLHSTLLDRDRPLWEVHVIEGLETGQVAVYNKIHHAGMDGAAGIVVANAMLDVTPEPREVEPPDETRRHRPRPSTAALAGSAVTHMASRYLKLIRLLPNAAKAVASVALPAVGVPGTASLTLPTSWDFAPRTPFNVAITGLRAFAAQTLPLDDAKAIAKALGVTINDVVMGICSGALRAYLEDHGGVPDKSLVATVPVSLRRAGDMRQNNQVTLTLASLASDVEDPGERLRAIHASCASAKHLTGNLKPAVPLDLPVFGAPWLMSALASLYGRSSFAGAIPPLANVVISNVPGPQFPLYFARAKVATYSPISIPYHGVALNITVQSYDGALEFGLTACRRAVRDVRRVADLLADALAEMRPLAPPPPKPAPEKKAKKAAPAKAKPAKAKPAKARSARAKPARPRARRTAEKT